jgi:hypothetical protein
VADAFKKAAGNAPRKIVAALLLIIVHNRTISEKSVAGLLLKKKLRHTQWTKISPATRHPPPTRTLHRKLPKKELISIQQLCCMPFGLY